MNSIFLEYIFYEKNGHHAMDWLYLGWHANFK